MATSRKITEIKYILDNIFKNNNYNYSIKIARLKRKWLEIVGKQLYQHIFPEKILKSILYVNCDHQGWINTMQFYKNDILNNINKILNNEIKINDIKFFYRKK